jgi:hypothetical protein
VLRRYPIIFVAPESLNIEEYAKLFIGDNNICFEFFEDRYFADIQGYNQLLTSSCFYARFLDYRFILIYQLDAFVFRDELEQWCGLNYDYIGAPWEDVKPSWGYYSKLLHDVPLIHRFLTIVKLLKCPPRNVGNGGFSLRKTMSHYRISSILNRKTGTGRLHEDIFWSFVVPAHIPWYTIPKPDVALRFAFEVRPRESFMKNNCKLPFGCHAWARYDKEFWMSIFASREKTSQVECYDVR